MLPSVLTCNHFHRVLAPGCFFEWLQRIGSGAWLSRVRRILKDTGWSGVAPFSWHHEALGAMSWQVGDGPPVRRRHGHLLREAWKRKLFANFLSSDRRDAWQLRHGAVYREAQVSRARMEFQRGSAHVCAVLSGAACSLAAYYVMASGQQCDLACPFCADQVPTWSHLVWACCAFQEIRGGLLCPDDAVAARLGWPTQINGRWSSRVSSLMAAVRAAVLERIPA